VRRIFQSYGADPRLAHLEYATDYDAALSLLRRYARGFLVIDTIQGAIGRDAYSREAGAHDDLNQKVHDIISLVGEGYAVLVVSQINDRQRQAPPLLHHLKLSGALEQATWIAAGYGKPAGGPANVRAFVVRKWRLPAPASYREAVLHLAVDDRERLTEVGLAAPSRPERPVQKPALPEEPVLRALVQEAKALTPTEIAARMKPRTSVKTVQRRLNGYRAAGIVERRDGGRYRVRPEGQTEGQVSV
jgi:hypothetical protein